ncbi:glycosyltransferase [Aquipuribacter sp. SD81]|uniref:glycosyltransferase n=1 Tax=Aquipuribacter sp. SD81 TaxID=3127703 RepID=UPI003019353A
MTTDLPRTSPPEDPGTPPSLAGTRALLLTSHPVDARDGADKELAVAVVEGLHDVRFTWFGRSGARGREPLRRGRRVALASLDGMPGPGERAQAAGLALALEPRVDLLHAVVTVGPRFADYVRLRRRLLGRRARPAVHTVPAVADPAALREAPALGTTVVLSKATQDLLLDAGYPDVRLFPPGIDLTRWAASPRPSGGPAVAAFAGHYDDDGGLWDTVEALGRLAREGTALRGLFLMRPRPGQDERQQANRLTARARAAGLDDVVVRGRVDDMPAALVGVDLLLLPARRLAGKADVPFTVLEAMATGRPVVVTDLPEMRALVGTAVTTAPGRVDLLADAVRDLLERPQQWQVVAGRGRALVEQQFSRDAMVGRYRELYAELLGAT